MKYELSTNGKTLINVNKDIKTFEIPNGVTEIGYRAFSNCVYLKDIKLSNSISIIGYNAFYGCENLLTIDTENITTIIDRGFYNCNKLISLNIPNVTIIGQLALHGCICLNNINSNLSKEQLIRAFGFENLYNDYLQRNRDYKLNKLLYEL